MQKKKNGSSRLRKIKKQCNFEKIKREIIKTQKTLKGAKKSKINRMLSCTPNFIGCFAENQLSDVVVTSFPCTMIINLDHDKMPGSHWVALHITQESLEIWDTLGFRILHWPRIPCTLLNFLHRMVVNRRLVVSKRIQSSQSILCGYFCIYFVICRPFMSLKSLSDIFTSRLTVNDKTLLKFFS